MHLSEKSAAETTAATSNLDNDHAAIESLLSHTKQTYTMKLDLRLIPILGCTYTILFLDRTNIANARIEGMEKSLRMPATGHNAALWIFFIPFVLVEVPSNIVLSLLRVQP